MSRVTSSEKTLEWKSLIEKQRVSGMSARKWCLQNQISLPAFYYWLSKGLTKELNKTSFTELSLKRPASILLQVRGVTLRMTSECDPLLRKQLLGLFAEGLC